MLFGKRLHVGDSTTSFRKSKYSQHLKAWNPVNQNISKCLQVFGGQQTVCMLCIRVNMINMNLF